MAQRIPKNFSTVDWSLVATMGNTMPPQDPNDDDDDDGTKTATLNRTMSASRRSSENPTKTNKREGSHSKSPALISVRLNE